MLALKILDNVEHLKMNPFGLFPGLTNSLKDQKQSFPCLFDRVEVNQSYEFNMKLVLI